jgi:phage virion morphogenesis protein
VSDLQAAFKGAELQRRLGKLARLDTRKILGLLGSRLLEQSRERLDNTKVDAEGNPWEPWSEAYRAKNPGGSMLEQSGQLLESLTVLQSADAVTVGSELLYAAVHLHGDEARGIPARPFMGFSDDDLVELGEIALDFFARETR